MEQLDIEKIVAEVVRRLTEPADDTIPLELSARHVHLSEADALELFGKLPTPKQELSQPGQFVCQERVRLVGPRGVIDNVAVLGPARGLTQVELSLTDARALGLEVPVRQSGDIKGTPGIIMTAGRNIIGIKEGVIVAGRHIHMTPEDAGRLNVRDGQMVCVLMEGQRPAIFRDVLIRVNPNYRLAMHIDFDEANGCGCTPNMRCRIVTGGMENICGIRSGIH